MVPEAKRTLLRASLVFEAYRGVLSFRCKVLENVRVKEVEIETECDRLVLCCYAFGSVDMP
jgi:hypothetical protein